MKKKKFHFIFIIVSLLLIAGCITLNQNTTTYAKERIITELNNTPIEELQNIEPTEEITEGEAVVEEETNSYELTELAIIIITTIVIIACVLNIVVTKFGTRSLIESLSTPKSLIYYSFFLIVLSSIIPTYSIIKTDANVLNGSEAKARNEKSIAIVEIEEDKENKDLKEESNTNDTSVIQVSNGATYTATNLELNKTSGTTTDIESSMYYGLNSAFIAKDNSNVILNNSSITTKSDYSTAFFITGMSTTATLTNISLLTENQYSNGLAISESSAINASKVNITTKGQNSSAIKTITNNSEVIIDDSTILTEGNKSPIFEIKGKVEATNIIATSTNSNIAVLENSSSLSIIESELITSSYYIDENFSSAFFLYKSNSKTASNDSGNSDLTIKDSKITVNKDSQVYQSAPLFYITNTTSVINITNTDINYGSNTLIKVSQNEKYGDIEDNGGEVNFTATDQTLKGNIIVDEISSIRFNLNNSSYKGQINGNDESKNVHVTLDKKAEWTLTGDSYLNTLTIQNGRIDRLARYIKSNGYNIYYNAENNEWLNGKTIRLSGGGKLIPITYES